MATAKRTPKLRYTKAPLPFQGQKRMYLKPFAKEIASFSATSTFIDLFGGSGLLSRTIKDIHPKARVIYNDYDYYMGRLAMIPHTEQLRKQLHLILGSSDNKRVDPLTANKIVDLLERHEAEGKPIDYVTLSSWIMFNMNYFHSVDELRGRRLYNKVASTPIAPATDYLEGLEIMHLDYRKLLNQYRDDPNAVFIFDPPYLSTDNTQYRLFWGINQYTEVLELLPTRNFVYFASGKSDFVQFLRWAESRLGAKNPFARAIKYERQNAPTSTSSYTDVMYVVH